LYWITGIPCPKCNSFFPHIPENHEKIVELFGTKRSNDLKETYNGDDFGLIKVCVSKRLIKDLPFRCFRSIYIYGCINGHRFTSGAIALFLEDQEKEKLSQRIEYQLSESSPEQSKTPNLKRLAWLFATRTDQQLKEDIINILMKKPRFGDDFTRRTWRKFFSYVSQYSINLKRYRENESYF